VDSLPYIAAKRMGGEERVILPWARRVRGEEETNLPLLLGKEKTGLPSEKKELKGKLTPRRKRKKKGRELLPSPEGTGEIQQTIIFHAKGMLRKERKGEEGLLSKLLRVWERRGGERAQEHPDFSLCRNHRERW